MINEKFLARFFPAVLMMMCSVAYAEMIRGEVIEIDPRGHFLKLARSNPSVEMREQEALQIFVSKETKFEGANLGDLRLGDEIRADVVKNQEGGPWSAKIIQLDKVNIRNLKETKTGS